MRRVAVTGAAGLIGSLIVEDLRRDHEVRVIDRIWMNGPAGRRQDTRRVGATEKLFAGVDTVVDLAGDPSVQSDWKTVTEENIAASVGCLEAARRAGVRRVVYASSSHVTGLYERDEPYASICAGRYQGLQPGAIPRITSAFAVRPDSPYAVGKVAAEAAARLYAEEHEISVICVRIGTVYAADRPGSPRGFATILSHADLHRLVRACLRAPEEVRFGIFYGVSANRWRFWDLDEGRKLVGYEPVDDAGEWRGHDVGDQDPRAVSRISGTRSRSEPSRSS